MSIDYAKRLIANMPLNLDLVESSWNWPPKAALKIAAEALTQGDADQLNRDLDLFSRTRLKSSRLVKMLRVAQDEAWEIEQDAILALTCQKVA